MKDTSGFYKNENGQLLYAPNGVISTEYNLEREYKDTYKYPVDGWYWFISEVDAYTFLGIDVPSNTIDTELNSI